MMLKLLNLDHEASPKRELELASTYLAAQPLHFHLLYCASLTSLSLPTSVLSGLGEQILLEIKSAFPFKIKEFLTLCRLLVVVGCTLGGPLISD